MTVEQAELLTVARDVPTHRRLEYYSTNPDDVRAFLDVVGLTVELDARLAPLVTPGRRFLDPSAGGCERNLMPYPLVLEERGLVVDTMDLRADSRAAHRGDFLGGDLPPGGPWDGVATNPPFRLFREFVRRTHEVLDDGTIVALLLPVRCQEPRTRSYESDVAFWRDFRPAWMFTHPRLKFGGAVSRNGKGSSAFDHYAHFVWIVGGGDEVTRCRPVSDAADVRAGALFGGAA